MPRILFVLFLLLITNFATGSQDLDFCVKSDGVEGETVQCGAGNNFSRKRYILYEIIHDEGFNLRRYIYVYLAIFVKKIIEENKEFEWNLVLPPWGNIKHWKSGDVGSQNGLPWGLFFDIPSLQKYVPVLEMYDFVKEYPSSDGETSLDISYILQHDLKMHKSGKFEYKNEIEDCREGILVYGKLPYEKLGENKFLGNFSGYSNITIRDVKCVTLYGNVTDLKKHLLPMHRSIVFHYPETAVSGHGGSKDYWAARRSMRFNHELYEIANEFRKIKLNSDDVSDKTERSTDWEKEKAGRNPLGGPYLSVHLRRQDFLYKNQECIPTIENAAFQIKKKLGELKLTTIFVSTDAKDEEYEELNKYLNDYTVTKFIASEYVRNKFKDGGMAIIDQIISSYARYFIGTYESTFTYRIQEERLILGFTAETTFNRFNDEKKNCSEDYKWKIIW